MLSPRRWAVRTEAGAELIRARWTIKRLSEPALVAMLGPRVDAPEPVEGVLGLGPTLQTVAAALPGSWNCLELALAGQRMLTRRGRAAELHLGASADGDLTAHAWLTSDGHPVVGEPGEHARLGTFGRPSRR